MQSFRKSSLCVVGLLATGLVGHAATLESYFDFTQYGTVTGGSQITSNVYGDAVATVKSTATSLTSGGLAITAGTNAGSTGVTLAGSQLASFTGDFSFQIWFTSASALVANSALFGGTTSATIDNDLRPADQAFFGSYNNSANPAVGFLRVVANNNNQYGITSTAPNGTGAAVSTLFNYTVTYTASTHTFQAYLNGAAVGAGMTANSFNGLSALTNGFSIGGVASPAFNDNAAGVTISSSLFYTGALTSTEISNIHAFGADVTVSELISAGVTATPVPEPSAFAALAGVVGLGFAAARRRRVSA